MLPNCGNVHALFPVPVLFRCWNNLSGTLHLVLLVATWIFWETVLERSILMRYNISVNYRVLCNTSALIIINCQDFIVRNFSAKLQPHCVIDQSIFVWLMLDVGLDYLEVLYTCINRADIKWEPLFWNEFSFTWEPLRPNSKVGSFDSRCAHLECITIASNYFSSLVLKSNLWCSNLWNLTCDR